MNKSLLLSAAALAAAVTAASAQSSGPLSGAIYLDGSANNLNSVAGAVSVINSAAGPNSTFTSTLLNTTANGGNGYTGNDSSTISQFLGSAGDTTAQNGATQVQTFVLDLRGTITPSVTGTYTFSDNNDDGGAFFLNGTGVAGSGTELAENDGDHGPVAQSGTAVLTAGQAYPIEYVAYNSSIGGGGGIQSVADITGPGSIVSSAVPEPSTWLAAGGLLLLAAGDFRRRLRA